MTEFTPPPESNQPQDRVRMSPTYELLSDVLAGSPDVLNNEQGVLVDRMVQSTIPFILDRGLNTGRVFHDEATDRTYEVDALPILRRGAATYLVTKSARMHDLPIASNYMLDIAKLRQADQMRDAGGNSAADVLLIRVAAEMQNAIDSQELAGDQKVTLSRYGGDEFNIALQGHDWTVEQRSKLSRSIVNAVEDITDLPDDLLPVGIKNGVLERIDPPAPDSLDRDIYDLYAQRGLILDADNIARIRSQWPEESARRHFEEFRRESTHTLYPESMAKAAVEEKIQFLKTKHPEFSDAIDAAVALDRMLENGSKHQSGLAEFIENVVYDQLLGENFYTFDDFQNHVVSGVIEQVHVYDLKFIKEVNDNLGLVRGDEIIQEFWENNIKPRIPGEDMDKLILGRRGGTIFIGMRAGAGGFEQLSDSAQELLTGALAEATISGARLPIGYASSDISANEPNFDVRLNELFVEADRKWYERMALDLVASGGDSESILRRLNRSERVDLASIPLQNKEGELDFYALTTHFMMSPKRAEERQAELRKAIQDAVPVIDLSTQNPPRETE